MSQSTAAEPPPRPKPKKISYNKRMIVWEIYNGRVWSAKCYTPVCPTIITVRNFDVGHDVPSSLGGSLDVNNLRPICRACNVDMGNRFCIEGPRGYNASMRYERPGLFGRLAQYVSRQADIWATWALVGRKKKAATKPRAKKRVRLSHNGTAVNPRPPPSSHTAARPPPPPLRL